jgi:hypothetical protein
MKKEISVSSPLVSRLKVLSGIVENKTLAILYIPKTDTTIQFEKLPNWFDILRYKICGFKYTKIRNCPTDKNTKNKFSKVVEFDDPIIKSCNN